MISQQEDLLEKIKTEYLEEEEENRKEYNRLVHKLGENIDEFNEEETPEKLKEINDTLDEIHDFFIQNKYEEELITEDDMREVAEMIAADESWE